MGHEPYEQMVLPIADEAWPRKRGGPQMGTINKLLNAIDLVNKYAYNGVGLLFAPLTLIAVFEVGMRYLFNRPTIWAWDINLQLFSFIVVFGAGNTLFQGGHVVMDIFISRFSKRARLKINMAVYVVFFFAMSLILWELTSFAWRSLLLRERVSTLFAPVVYPLKIGIFIGVSLLFLQAVSLFVRDLITYATMSKEGERG
jgi:TRAP-type mannitol/chloroaromatic compound transport system permease small subunit